MIAALLATCFAVRVAAASTAGTSATPASPPAPPEEAALPLPDANPAKAARPPAERFGTTGFRGELPENGGAVSTRVALVEDFDGPFIGEVTLRGGYAWQGISVAAEVAGTGAASPYWSAAGVGNVVIDARGRFGRGSTHALGLRGTFPAAARRGGRGTITWWGTVPSATTTVAGVAVAYEGAAPRVMWHVHLGLRATTWGGFSAWDFVDAGLLFATAQPVAERWEVVAELEALWEPSPVHIRGLARVDLGRKWTLDAGLALPLVVFFADPTLQVLGRLERCW